MKKQIVTGLIGAASLLAMAASGAYAAYPTCVSGKISAIEAGYHDAASWGGGCSRMLKMTCNDTSGDLAGKTGVYCVYSSIDSDGIVAAALTATSDTKSVGYQIYGLTGTAGTYGNGIVLSLTLLNP